MLRTKMQSSVYWSMCWSYDSDHLDNNSFNQALEALYNNLVTNGPARRKRKMTGDVWKDDDGRLSLPILSAPNDELKGIVQSSV